jgi:hypothetical protein
MPLLGTVGAGSVKSFGGLANLGYFIKNSLRFRSSASANLSRTPGSSGNQRTWTWSAWVKRGILTTDQMFFSATNTYMRWGNGTEDTLWLNFRGAGGTNYFFQTTQVFRDPAAWYHIVLAVDTTQATDTNRVKLYVNGSRITAFTAYADYPPQNTDTAVNSTTAHTLGSYSTGAIYFDGYMAEIRMIDGQQLTPSSFAKTDAATGQWIPIKYSGTYGTNGYYLNYADKSAATAAAIGKDSSGNGNNWTPNNISVTAGTTYDAMIDSPTLSAAASNFAVLNPLDIGSNAPTITNGSLSASTPTTGGGLVRATMAVSSGKWYWETTLNSQATYVQIGISSIDYTASAYTYLESIPGALYFISGFKGTGPTGTNTSYGSSVANGDVVGVALDMDAGTLIFYKNGVSMGTAFTSITGTYFPSFADSTNSIATSFDVNFGQRPFAYTIPSGYKTLNTFNLP